MAVFARKLMFTGLILVAGCSSRPPLDRDAFHNDGTSLRSDSQTSSAIGDVPANERLKSPVLIDAAIRSGNAQVANKEYIAGAELYRRAYDGRPDISTLVLMSRALRLGGQAQQAVLTLQGLEKVHGNSQAYLVELGRAAMAGGYSNEARKALEKAVSRSDAGWAAFLTMGVFQARTGQVAAARTAFEQAGRRASNEGERDAATADIAMLEAEEGRIDAAISMLEPLAAGPSAHRKTVATLAVLYGLKGDRTRYLETARKSGMTVEEIEMGSRWLDISSSEEIKPAETASHRRSANHRP